MLVTSAPCYLMAKQRKEVSDMTTQEKVIEMKKEIVDSAKKYGLNLTIYDCKIGFVDQEQKKIVALWTPDFKLEGE